MQHENSGDMNLAVLIDADNAPRTRIRDILAEVAIYGTPTIKRIYGDWTSPNLASWKNSLLELAIIPVQQYAYTTGKNSTDSAMIIDAMDILYAGKVDGFCLVSSDSDFTRLATRLREAGKKVYGIGEKKTPSAFISACDRFIYTEIFSQAKKAETAADEVKQEKTTVTKKTNITKKQAEPKIPKDIKKLLIQTVQDVADEDGWAFLGMIGNLMIKKRPEFDSRNYGFPRLNRMISAMGCFAIEERSAQGSNGKQVYVKVKEK